MKRTKPEGRLLLCLAALLLPALAHADYCAEGLPFGPSGQSPAAGASRIRELSPFSGTWARSATGRDLFGPPRKP